MTTRVSLTSPPTHTQPHQRKWKRTIYCHDYCKTAGCNYHRTQRESIKITWPRGHGGPEGPVWGWWSHRRFEVAAERRGGRRRRDRLRGRGWGRKEPSAVSRAVPLESPNVERSLRLFQRRRRPKTTTKTRDASRFFYFYLFIFVFIQFSSRRRLEQDVTCGRELKYIHAFGRSRERVRADETPSCFGEWNLLPCVCFDYGLFIPKRLRVQSLSVRRRPLIFFFWGGWGIYIRIVFKGKTPKEDSARASELLPPPPTEPGI